jgi:SLT domain-containing protein/phage-related minor tail protein
MPSVGYATIQIIPSVRGISEEIRRQLTGPAGDAGEAAGQESGSRFADKWKTGLAAAGAAAGAVLVAATVSAVEKEKAGDRLAAQLGLSGKGAKEAGKVAGTLYSKAVVDSFEDGAAAVRAVMGSGLIPAKATTKSIEAITTKVADLANTFEQDLGGTANAAAQMIRTGLAKDGAQALDLLTKGFQSSANKADDFLDTINEYGTQFRKAGLDGATSIGLLNQAIAAGARDADIAADAIKEFSIRAVDGSTSTAQGFNDLGLSGVKMAKDFAAGGATANAALDLTLDRLRGVADPVKQSRIAVALFGTQAEDLGKALFAMDPSTAAAGLGKVGNAAKTVGDTIRGNTATQLAVLQRQLTGVIGVVVTSVILPALNALIAGIRQVDDVISGIVGWFREWGIWLTPLGILITGITLTMTAQAIAVGAVTAVFSLYRGAILAWMAVQRGAIAVQAAFNAVLSANPIGLIITVLVALAAAVYIAYQRSETFRNIVTKAWQGIQAAASYAWNSILKPAFDGLMTGLRAIGAAAMWLWTNAIQPAFGFISTAVRILATIFTIVLLGPMYVAFLVIGKVATWLWSSVLQPTFSAIGTAAMWLWTNAIQPAFSHLQLILRAAGAVVMWLWTSVIKPGFNGVMVILRAVGSVVLWLWNNVFKPGFNGIGVIASWLWNNAIKPAFDNVKSGIQVLSIVVRWLWTSVIAPVFGWIGDKAKWLWTFGIKPSFDLLKKGIAAVGDSFEDAKNFISRAWTSIQDIAKEPVRFIIEKVYNAGIVPVWNKVASAFGAPKISPMDISGWATGGVLPGYTPGRDVHLAALSGGEAVMRPEWTRAVGPGYVHHMNAAARHGGVAGVQRALGLPGFADGGIFGWIGDKAAGVGSAVWDGVKKGASWLKDSLEESARAGVKAVVDPLLRNLPGADTQLGKMLRRIPNKILDAVFGYAKEADDKGAGGVGPIGGVVPTGKRRVILTQALAAAGVPPPGTMGQWLAGLNTLITRESGWNASAINNWDINAKNGVPSQGLAQTIPPTWSAHVPASLRSRGILDPVANVAAAIRYIVATYGSITGVQQANANKSPKGYASGGRPRAGELAWVGENGPELVRFGSGRSQVFDHRTSMGMAEGAFSRGFAKGTAGARAAARKDLPADLGSFTKALTGSAALISAATKALTTDLVVLGRAGKRLAATTLGVSSRLQKLANQRDAVASRIATARQAAADQRRTASDFLGLSNLSGAATATDVLAGMYERQTKLKNFQKSISSLSKRGLNQGLIQQLVAMGPDSALAGVVAGATGDQIREFNSLAKGNGRLAGAFGNVMADAMYDAGSQAGKGFLAGLIGQQKALQAQMAALGKALVSSIKSQLKIKSPSQIMRDEVGEPAALGVAVGLDRSAATVAASATRIASAAVPGLPPATRLPGAAGFAPGQRLRLVVRDREFDAYIEDIADERIDTTVRALAPAIAGRRG